MKRYILILLLVFSSQIIPQKYGAVEGRVTDIETGKTISNVNVIIFEVMRGVVTDENGYFRINKLRPGKYEIRVSSLGYDTITFPEVEIVADSTTVINFELLTEEVIPAIFVIPDN